MQVVRISLTIIFVAFSVPAAAEAFDDPRLPAGPDRDLVIRICVPLVQETNG